MEPNRFLVTLYVGLGEPTHGQRVSRNYPPTASMSRATLRFSSICAPLFLALQIRNCKGPCVPNRLVASKTIFRAVSASPTTANPVGPQELCPTPVIPLFLSQCKNSETDGLLYRPP